MLWRDESTMTGVLVHGVPSECVVQGVLVVEERRDLQHPDFTFWTLAFASVRMFDLYTLKLMAAREYFLIVSSISSSVM